MCNWHFLFKFKHSILLFLFFFPPLFPTISIHAGSSTDLSPSVIAYYDRLSSSSSADTVNSSNSNCNGSINRSLESTTASSTSLSAAVVESFESTISRAKSTRPPLPKLPPPSIRLQSNHNRRNFRALSPNVQRIISHSNTALDTVHSADMDESRPTPIGNESFLHERRTNSTLAKLPHSGGTGSKFKHPLSKNTCKLSQSGNELVIDDSDAGYATPSDSSEFTDVKNNNLFAGGADMADDHDKTPTNENVPEIDFAAAAVAAAAEASTTMNAERDENSNQVLDESKMKLCAIVIGCDEQKKDCLEKASIARPAPSAPTTPSALLNLPKNSGSFLHSMFAKSDDKMSPLLMSDRRTSQFYVEQDEDVPNGGPLITRPTPESTTAPIANGNSAKNVETPALTEAATPTTVDLKRTKIRPLSSVSISSTSSSSSTGSDEMSPNQTAISYLASVESLADHSESESPRLVNSITVLERACMEIVDSEQNYVDDLGQVINGWVASREIPYNHFLPQLWIIATLTLKFISQRYLNDWKERSCLESSQLNLLFGNIVEVYDFNMILLDELKSSGMEPARIAKCFIKLHDQFDAYTQYWWVSKTKSGRNRNTK